LLSTTQVQCFRKSCVHHWDLVHILLCPVIYLIISAISPVVDSILKQPTNISMNMTNQDKCMYWDGTRKQVMSLTVPCDLTMSFRYLAAAFTLRTSCGQSSAYGIFWLPSSSTNGATSNFSLCGWLMMWLTGLSVNAPICFALSWPLAG